MPVYEYKALDREGKTLKGSLESDNKKTAQSQLREQGLFLQELKVKNQNATQQTNFMLKKISLKNITVFTRLLATLLKANIPLVEALDSIGQQTVDVYFKQTIINIKEKVNEGKPFHLSLKDYSHIFDNIFVSLVEAGELGGNLDKILERIADLMEKRSVIRSRVMSALIYPGILLFVTVVIMVVLSIYVIPTVTEIFEDQEALPWMTLTTIGISNFLINYWLITLIGLLIFAFLFWRWKKTASGKVIWDRFIISLPVLGRLIRAADISIFARTFSTLMMAGVPVLESLDIVKNVVKNELIRQAIEHARSQIKEGETIVDPLRQSGQFPAVVLQMIHVGEKTGSLESMLAQISENYDREVDVEVSAFTSLLGPVMLIVMACVIGFVLVSIMLPMLGSFDDLG